MAKRSSNQRSSSQGSRSRSSNNRSKQPSRNNASRNHKSTKSIVNDPRIFFILGSVILIAIILLAILGNSKKSDLKVADQEIVTSDKIVKNESLDADVVSSNANTVAENSSTKEEISSEASSGNDADRSDENDNTSKSELSSTPSATKVNNKVATNPVDSNGKFSISPGTQLSFSSHPLTEEIQTEKELLEKKAAIVTSLYETDQIPMIITANVDGNLDAISLQSRIQAAKLYNDETAGWIRIKGTVVDFAVVQNQRDNVYYQSLGYDKKYSHHVWGSGVRKYGDYGVIWAAYNANLTSREDLSDNTVIFGHNWENISANPRMSDPGDVMFEHIAGYAHVEYAQENPYIDFSINGEDMKWVVVSAFYTEDLWVGKTKGVDFDYVDTEFTDSQKEIFISEIEKRSEFSTNDELTIDDHFLTLSTCTRAKGSTDRQRFVVVARLIREGEELPVLDYQVNPSPKAPIL